MQQYIAHYKSNKNNNTNNIAYFFKKLPINISKDFSPNKNTIYELFFILFDFFQNIKLLNTINLLVNNVFKYQIMSINNIIAFVNTLPYNFTILIDLQ